MVAEVVAQEVAEHGGEHSVGERGGSETERRCLEILFSIELAVRLTCADQQEGADQGRGVSCN